MKSMIKIVTVAGMLVSFAGIAAAHDSRDYGDRRGDWGRQEWRNDGRHDKRQSLQRHRIRNGARCGDLTRGEVRRLERGQARIHRFENRFERDGRLSWRERQRLERLQDRESRRIARMRHNRWS